MDSIKIKESAEFIKKQVTIRPKIGIILGSGLGVLAAEVENRRSISYSKIPHFPVSTVEGHAGQMVFGTLAGNNVVLMQGRFHFYEGYLMEQVVFPVRVMHQMGIEILIVTNAAGGINRDFKPGDLMIITDHINLMGNNPLLGPNYDELGPRFPDMSEAYNRDLIRITEGVAEQEGLGYQKGVYVSLTGPTYETPAEVNYLRIIGGDAVGMSTVPEVIVANHAGIRVLGISCVTNMAAGVLTQKLQHQEVMETAERVRDQFIALVKGVVHEVKT